MAQQPGVHGVSAATATRPIALTGRAPLRDYKCPRCGSFLFATSAPESGLMRVKCKGAQDCRRWVVIDLATGKEHDPKAPC